MSNLMAIAANFAELSRSSLAQALGWALLHLLWQGALVAGILAAALSLMQRRSANARYLVSCAALAVLLILGAATTVRLHEPPIAGLATSVAASAFPASFAGSSTDTISHDVLPAKATTFAAALQFAGDHLPQILLAWLTGVLLLSLRLLSSWMTAHRVASYRVRPASDQWQNVAARLSHSLHLDRAIQLLESASVEVPTVIGWLRPAVLLPAATISGLSLEQMEMILAHELAHVRRHDFFVNLMQAAVETLLFYHPAVWWISNRIRLEREHCCDDAALSVCGNAILYARALTRLEELRAPASHAFVAANGGSLLTRIRRLAGIRVERSEDSSRWLAGTALLTILTVLLLTPSLSLGARTSELQHSPAISPAERSTPATARVDVLAGESADVDADDPDQPQDRDDDPAPTIVDMDDAQKVEQAEGWVAPPAPPAFPSPAVAPTPSAPPVPPVPGPAMATMAEDSWFEAPPPPATPPSAPRPPRASHDVPALPAPPAPPAPAATLAPPMALHRAPRHSARVLTIPELRALSAVAPVLAEGFAQGVVPEINAAAIQRSVDAAMEEVKKHSGEFRMRARHESAEGHRMRLESMKHLGASQREALRALRPSQEYIERMRKAGVNQMSLDDLQAMHMFGVTPESIAALRRSGVAVDSLDTVLGMHVQRITPAYIAGMRDAGRRDLDTEDLMALHALGVTPEYVRQMTAAGYENLSAQELEELRACGVTASLVQALTAAGYQHLPVRELARMAAMGINADFLRNLAKYRTH